MTTARLMTIQEFKAGYQSPLKEDDDVLDVLDSVTQLFEKETGRPWTQDTADVYYASPPDDRATMIWLPRRPVASIALVEERWPDESTWTQVGAGSYVLAQPNLGRVEKLGGLNWATNVRVTYSGGYDPTTCPRDVKRAIITQANFMRIRLSPEKLAARGTSMQGGGVTFLERSDFHPLFVQVAQANRRLR